MASARLGSGVAQGAGQRTPWALLYMLASAFLLSIVALLGKYLQQFSGFELLFWRSAGMLLGGTAGSLLHGTPLLGDPGTRGALLAIGFAWCVYFSCWFYSIKMLDLGDAVVIFCTAPAITGVLGLLLLNEPWGVLDASGAVVSLLGVVFIAKPPLLSHLLGFDVAPPPPILGLALAVLSAFLSAVKILMCRMNKDIPPFAMINAIAIVAIVLAPLFGWVFDPHFVLPEGLEWALLAALGALSTVGTYCTLVSLGKAAAGKATAMNYTQVAFAFMWQSLFFNNHGDLFSKAGAMLVTSSALFALAKDSSTSGVNTDCKDEQEGKAV